MSLTRTPVAVEQRIKGKCGMARASEIVFTYRGGTVETPIFMPVGTQGTIKGTTPEEVGKKLGCKIILGNTYHLGHRPGVEVIRRLGGLHKAMRWGEGRAILTDSGGFQMVSLAKLTVVSEEGVKFTSPHDGSEILLTPEASMKLQQGLGSDIAMALDDVVRPTSDLKRIHEASERTVRWLDRCESVITRGDPKQALFGIVQGGLDSEMRDCCAKELVRRNLQGYAVGGLSGGEEKGRFWKAVAQSARMLPEDKPRYAMGIGYPEDMLVCVSLGIDMFDCVWPTRTARFGTALVQDFGNSTGSIDLKSYKLHHDGDDEQSTNKVLDPECPCEACSGNFTRETLHAMLTSPTSEPLAAQLLTLHNISHQLRLMKKARQSILKGEFGKFIQHYMLSRFAGGKGTISSIPKWILEALEFAGITFPTSIEAAFDSFAMNSLSSFNYDHILGDEHDDEHDKK